MTAGIEKHIEKRGRSFEKSIRIDYLTGLQQRYEDWIKNYKGELIITMATGPIGHMPEYRSSSQAASNFLSRNTTKRRFTKQMYILRFWDCFT